MSDPTEINLTEIIEKQVYKKNEDGELDIIG